MNFIQVAAAFILGAISAAGIFIFLKKKEEHISALKAEACNSKAVRDAIEDFKKSKEFRLIKKTEYNKGLNQGMTNTINDFQIQYQKFENVDENLFTSTVETGYFMQLTYRGLPIGDVTKRVIHAGKKVDKKRVDEIISRLNETVSSLIQAAMAGKIPVKEVKHLLNKKK